MRSHSMYAVEEPIEAHKSLRKAAWVKPEQFFIQAFVGTINDPNQYSGIGENYAQPQVRQHRVEQVQPARAQPCPLKAMEVCGPYSLRTRTHVAVAIDIFP